MSKKKTVLLIFGGPSTEHEISCRSTYTIVKALRNCPYNIHLVGIAKDRTWIPFLLEDELLLQPDWEVKARSYIQSENYKKQQEKQTRSSDKIETIQAFISQFCGYQKPDVVYLGVHGINCEDGRLQGLLDWANIPYIGCDTMTSALTMNKAYTKIIVQSLGIPQVNSLIVDRYDYKTDQSLILQQIEEKIGFPCFLKPNNGGSSVGTKAVIKKEELKDAISYVLSFDPKMVVESFIDAREIEVAIMGNETLYVAPPGELVKHTDVLYYDYESKYKLEHATHTELPAQLDEQQKQTIEQYAKQIYKGLGCKGLSRVDFFIDRNTNHIYFNEINTLPGFTSISMFPMGMKAIGFSLEEVLMKLIDLAILRKAQEKQFEENK